MDKLLFFFFTLYKYSLEKEKKKILDTNEKKKKNVELIEKLRDSRRSKLFIISF